MYLKLQEVARLAQSVEHGTLNPRVVGSSPTSGAPFFLFLHLSFFMDTLIRIWCSVKIASSQAEFVQARLAQLVEHGTFNPRVVGSSPTSGAYFPFVTDVPQYIFSTV